SAGLPERRAVAEHPDQERRDPLWRTNAASARDLDLYGGQPASPIAQRHFGPARLPGRDHASDSLPIRLFSDRQAAPAWLKRIGIFDRQRDVAANAVERIRGLRIARLDGPG